MTRLDPTADLDQRFEAWRAKPPGRAAVAAVFDAPEAREAQRLVKRWNAASMGEAASWPDAQRVHVALAGFTTLQYLAPHVEAALLADGFVPRVTVGPYNQLFQSLADPGGPVLAAGVDVVWIWCNLLDLLPLEFQKDAGALSTAAGLEAVDRAIDALVAQLASARRRSRALFLVNEFVPTRRSPLGIASGAAAPGFEGVHRHANLRLEQALRGLDAARVFPLGRSMLQLGLERALDPRLALIADSPYTSDLHFRASAALRPYVRALKGATRKVLVLDADNTLWGGVVGEEGWEGIRIGVDPVGTSYTRFQEAILELYRRGVILALNSKNNAADVEEVFEKRPEMVLKLEHFASTQINWRDKVANCRAIAEEINVGLDSLVFWDDNPAERLLVRESLPDVQVVEVSSDRASWADALRETTWFDALEITVEDAERGRMYAEDRVRRQAEVTATDMDSFLRSLDLKVTASPGSDVNLARIVSLLSRTNQFNLTTRRHPEARVREMANAPTWSVLCYSAADRFGDYGIVGVTIMQHETETAVIDSLLLSCRAMGKGIEHVMLATLARQARAWGARRIVAAFLPTRKNAPARDYLPSLGFERVADAQDRIDYELDLLARDVSFPEHVAIQNGVLAS